MSSNRLEFIDALKGFAIFCMVLGHAMSWNYYGSDSIVVSAPFVSLKIDDILYILPFRLVNSFHMAILFFISGYLTVFRDYAGFSIKRYIKKRTLRLFLPYLATGFLPLLVTGVFGYWFILTLFFINLTVAVVEKLCNKIGGGGKFLIYLFISVTIFLIGYIISKHNMFVGIANDIFSSVNAISNYLMVFISGMSLRTMESNNSNFYIGDSYKSGLLIISLACFFFKNYIGVPLYISYFISLLSRITFSVVFFEFFRNLKKHSRFLLYCGTYSMQIYLLHILFMIEEPELMKNMMSYFSGCALFVIPLLVCGIYSLISIALSIISSSIISKDRYIAKLIFGSVIK